MLIGGRRILSGFRGEEEGGQGINESILLLLKNCWMNKLSVELFKYKLKNILNSFIEYKSIDFNAFLKNSEIIYDFFLSFNFEIFIFRQSGNL